LFKQRKFLDEDQLIRGNHQLRVDLLLIDQKNNSCGLSAL
jgi:hypothetical protein